MENKIQCSEKKAINVNEKTDVDYWTEKLNVSKVQLKAAINAVGDSAIDVEAYLNKKTSSRS